MEDAVVLGAVFRQTRDIAAALREYEAQRCDRVRDLVLKARKRCDITHGKDMQLTEAAELRGAAHYQRHVRHHPQRAAGLTVAMDSITALSV
ncbi:FAD-dependent urate hydroxylase [Klebsiella pneumoniae]|nr:FAD-dependent urate hydroxylase [Klebsiella pneumoniae]